MTDTSRVSDAPLTIADITIDMIVEYEGEYRVVWYIYPPEDNWANKYVWIGCVNEVDGIHNIARVSPDELYSVGMVVS